MFLFRQQICRIAAVICALALLPALVHADAMKMSSGSSTELQTARSALAKYQDPYVAVRDGYFSTLACVDFPSSGTLGGMSYPAGGMGVHFLNPALIGAKLDLHRPQVLIYEPVQDQLRLVAAEWFVPTSSGVKKRPQLFGQEFYGPMMGHYPIMPVQLTHYDLHVWLWKANRAGIFIPTNPAVHCSTAYTVHEKTPMPMKP